ncbi:hypothetical protein DPMN_099316 [Dreissena polymorpha]|uniref:Uncharacterized protein n=1 Tax=Dreissena polymorpha TaxID=45954 RepID=A0A9D4R749_DREPO|nr:hypothetical protein DPMN_099316 [Dreissena polymorpha]
MRMQLGLHNHQQKSLQQRSRWCCSMPVNDCVLCAHGDVLRESLQYKNIREIMYTA